MRINHTSLEDFLEDLDKDIERGGVCFQNVLFVNIALIPDTDGLKHEALVLRVLFNVAVLVQIGQDESQVEYFRCYGEKCGRDYRDGEKETEGTSRAKELKATVREFADAKGLHLMTGVPDY